MGGVGGAGGGVGGGGGRGGWTGGDGGTAGSGEWGGTLTGPEQAGRAVLFSSPYWSVCNARIGTRASERD